MDSDEWLMGEEVFGLEDLVQAIEIRRQQHGSYTAAMAEIGQELDELAGSECLGRPFDAMDALIDEICVIRAAYSNAPSGGR